MKSKIYFSILLFLISICTFSQVRPDIYSFSSTQRTQLVNAMMDYIDEEIVQQHCDYLSQSGVSGLDIHSDFDFLPFHRLYLEGMEDYLLEQGLSQYVPLPKWDPSICTPSEFQIVDPDCANITCQFGSSGTCTGQNNWCPGVSLPFFLSTNIQSGSNNDICDWPFLPTTPGVSNSNGLSRVIEGQSPNPVNSTYHNSVHNIMGSQGGVMGNFRSPAAPIFWLWHAYVDDVWKSWECNCSQSTTLPYDLYMKDNDYVMQSERDRGEEPTIDDGPMWVSKDIWVRQTNDGLTNHTHQNPEYSTQDPNYVYVQIRNRGCVANTAGETLEVYWAKAATALEWPDYWDGTVGIPSAPGTDLSGLVGTVSLPSIEPGDSYIAELPWVVPDPDDYVGLGSDPVFWADQPHHFCLAAKFESQDDPLVVNTTSMYDFTQGNNNVVWKNISIVDLDPNNIAPPGGGWDDIKIKPGGNILVGDATGDGGTYDLEFTIPDHIQGNAITEEAEIRVKLDEPLWNIWEANGFQGENVGKLRRENHEIIIIAEKAVIKNLPFAAHERYLVNVRFNFLTEELTGQEFFEYDVNQKESATGKLVGGERYELHVPVRELFFADAGPDKEILRGEFTDINAYEVAEEASYKWYSPEGKLLFEGKDISVSPEITTQYRLEVMAERDGAVDYDEVTVSVKPYYISTIAPNPVQDNMQVNYMAEGASSAYLMITQPYGNTYNQILDTQATTQNINTSQWSTGYYVVVLVCDGEAMDSKNIIVE